MRIWTLTPVSFSLMLLVNQWDKLVGYALLIYLENLLQLLLLPRMIYIQHKLDKFGGAICNLNKINVFGNNPFFLFFPQVWRCLIWVGLIPNSVFLLFNTDRLLCFVHINKKLYWCYHKHLLLILFVPAFPCSVVCVGSKPQWRCYAGILEVWREELSRPTSTSWSSKVFRVFCAQIVVR